jgi:dihydroorotate dehydrogenase
MPLLRLVEPERAHKWALQSLSSGVVRVRQKGDATALAIRALGTVFPNPIGLAAGFDKDGIAVLPLMRLGFGFVEAGTVTRLPQSGNPPPRLFRLERERAVINRMGFNNAGAEAFCQRLELARDRCCPLGANIGLNKSGMDPERDYSALVGMVGRLVDYITINVSSPNTPGLRDLQSEARLRSILQAIQSFVPVHPPLLIKIAPDLSDAGLEAVVAAAVDGGASGLIVSNTTIARPAELTGRNKLQAGGLSGAPLFHGSTIMLAKAARLAQRRLTLIGCGGIQTGADALTKIKSGASLVQLYTAFSYAGPALIPRIKTELVAALAREGFQNVTDAIGASL